MSDLLWCTDIHLNFLGMGISPSYDRGPTVKRFGTPFDFGKGLRAAYPEIRRVLITGDIAEADSVQRLLTRFMEGWQDQVLFVMGNHDYYHSSFEAVDRSMTEFVNTSRVKDKLIWLRGRLIPLTPDTALIGNEGWYDGRAADPLRSRIMMTDFQLIRELKNVPEFIASMKIRELAKKLSDDLEVTLRSACQHYKRVLVATHVPPFIEATFHEGEISNKDWLPWMCNVTLGDMLVQVAYEFPEVEIVTLCGHTHSPGTYSPVKNLRVFTGESTYWYPKVSGVIRLGDPIEVLTP